MNGSDERAAANAGQIVAIGLAMLLGVIITAVVVAKVNLPTPHVGDILVMRPAGDPTALPFSVRKMTANGTPGASCVLDTEIMARSGGSLVVESHAPGSDEAGYLVHWAGGPTSKGATDCGMDAVLALQARDVIRLSGAAMTPGAIRIPIATTMSLPGGAMAVN